MYDSICDYDWNSRQRQGHVCESERMRECEWRERTRTNERKKERTNETTPRPKSTIGRTVVRIHIKAATLAPIATAPAVPPRAALLADFCIISLNVTSSFFFGGGGRGGEDDDDDDDDDAIVYCGTGRMEFEFELNKFEFEFDLNGIFISQRLRCIILLPFRFSSSSWSSC